MMASGRSWVSGPRTDSIEETLTGIESRVLEEVWIGTGRSVSYGVLAAVSAVAVMVWWLDMADEVSAYGSNRLPAMSMVGLALAAIASAVALWRRRFRGCCVAACICGLAAVIGIGTFWWLHTGRPGAALTWLLVADVAAGLLTMGWLSLVVTPMECSQPQMRAYHEGVRRPS
ncbi:conserved membrane hypothetical protein [uncultured Mycobacterium sp.]|uniref:Transmembrane protein n=1 Tax=uncultured Mycobacterium sp. TaxID=171292 RepID=A0A1Y5PEX7_9MYCO|nr:conserved membrane hypothetical protein [uncultured Mycobacterium sp.]